MDGAARAGPGLPAVRARPGGAARRPLAVAGAVVALVSVSWMTAVSLVPAADRPYVDGSHDNSAFEQVFTYNGFGRFGDQTPQQVQAAQLDPGAAFPVPPRTADRLLRGGLGRDAGWLTPAAALVAAWGIASRRREPRGDPLRACFILWGGWLVTFFVVFSVITTLRPYYTAALCPAAAAIIGAGVVAARHRSGPRSAGRSAWRSSSRARPPMRPGWCPPRPARRAGWSRPSSPSASSRPA